MGRVSITLADTRGVHDSCKALAVDLGFAIFVCRGNDRPPRTSYR